MTKHNPIRRIRRWLAAALLMPALAAAQGPADPQQKDAQQPGGRYVIVQGRVADERSGSFVVREGERLKLSADMGNIRVRTHAAPELTYRVRIETMASEPGGEKLLRQFVLNARPISDGVLITAQVPWNSFRGRLWVSFDISVPQNFNLDVQTQAGTIIVPSLDGRATLLTAGGNIIAQRIGGTARLETKGGHITVEEVGGDLTAITSGGHINVGQVSGDALVRTGGGHVRVQRVTGLAQLETGGGNIYLEKAAADVSVNTRGGRIDFGEASGGIRARTGGGSVGVMRVTGPTEIESSEGSISLTNVQGAIRATTATGPITAWFIKSGPDGKLLGPSQLQSGQGDILVFLPRELSVTIDAVIESSAENQIEADPSLPLKFSYATSAGRRPIRAEAKLNGGGEVLKLRTGTGNIRLRYADDASGQFLPRDVAAIAQFHARMEAQRRVLEAQLRHEQQRIEQEIVRRSEQAAREFVEEMSRFQLWQRRLQAMVTGRVRVAAREQQVRAIFAPKPSYPAMARAQNIQGLVRLQVEIDADGSVQEIKVLSGHPILAPAAAEAVKQWKYAKTLVDGKPVAVVTTVDVEFRLN